MLALCRWMDTGGRLFLLTEGTSQQCSAHTGRQWSDLTTNQLFRPPLSCFSHHLCKKIILTTTRSHPGKIQSQRTWPHLLSGSQPGRRLLEARHPVQEICSEKGGLIFRGGGIIVRHYTTLYELKVAGARN